MKEIQLTQGYVALVDDADWEWLSQFNWFAWARNGLVYATRNPLRSEGGRRGSSLIYMHNQILGVKNGMRVDHKDRNSLNNRRENLRHCSHGQNICNSRTYCNNTSGYRGVSWDVSHASWKVQIKVDGKNVNVGRFHDPIEAALAYNVAALRHYGEFASLNCLPTEAANEPQI